MKVFNSNNPDGAAIQRDDEEFLAKCGGQYRVRHPHQSEIDLFAQQGGKMRNPWPVAIVKRVSAAKHELIIFLHDGQVSQPVSPQNEGRPDPPSASPVDELQRVVSSPYFGE